MAIGNAILVRWTGGNTWVEDAGSIAANGRREESLNLPGVTSAAQAQQVAGAVLELRARPRIRTTAGHLPTSEAGEPFTAYNVGDLVTAPGPDGSPVDLRVQSITVNESDDGTLEFSPELGSTIDELEDRLARFLAKFGTAPALENGSSSGGDVDPVGGDDPSYQEPTPTEPDPVPPTEPWIDPILIDPDLLGTTNIGNQDPEEPGTPDPDDPGLLNIFATVIVPGPDEGDDPTLTIEGPEVTFGEDSKVTFNGDEEHNGDSQENGHTGLAGVFELLEDYFNQNSTPGVPGKSGLIKGQSADVNNPTLALIWGGVRSLVGRLSGVKGSATDSTYIDKDGNWHFAQAVDFTDATVTGLGTGASGVVHHVEFMASGLIATGPTVIWRPFFDITVVHARYEVRVNNTTTTVQLLHNASQIALLNDGGTATLTADVDAGDALEGNWTDDGSADNYDGLLTVWYTARS